MSRSYEIKERPANLGGGWVLMMFEDEEEMGRGYYPLFRQDRPLGVMRLNLSLKPYSLRLKPMVSWVSLSTD